MEHWKCGISRSVAWIGERKHTHTHTNLTSFIIIPSRSSSFAITTIEPSLSGKVILGIPVSICRISLPSIHFRLETGSLARDLLEQAHFVVEIQCTPPHVFASSLAAMSCVPTIVVSSASAATAAVTVSLVGPVNSSNSAGTMHCTAPARLHVAAAGGEMQRLTSPDGGEQLNNCVVQLQPVGLTYPDVEEARKGAAVVLGPAALVFHWDVEALLGE